MNNIVETANSLADKSDRWLFVAAILILIIGGVVAIRYLVARNESALKENQQRGDAYTASLKEIAEKQISTNQSLAVVLDRNTTALNECTTELRMCRESRI